MAVLSGDCVHNDYTPNIKASISFLKSKYLPSSNYKSESKEMAYYGGLIAEAYDIMYEQAIATLALIEEPGEGWPFYYWYYGTRAMLKAGGEDWRIWKAWMCRLLVDNQNDDGSWEAAQSYGRKLQASSITGTGAFRDYDNR